MLTWKDIPPFNRWEIETPCVLRIEQFAPNHSMPGGFYYWWAEGDVGLFGQFPEYLHLDDPDTDWRGPFETEQEAIADCRSSHTATH
jgi:hypothetical protein